MKTIALLYTCYIEWFEVPVCGQYFITFFLRFSQSDSRNFVFGTRRCFQKTKNWIRLFLYILGLRAVCDTTPPNLLDTASASVRRQQPIKCTAARRSLPSLWRSFGMLGARFFAHTTEKDVFSWTAIGVYWGQKKRRKIEYGLDLGLIQ